MRINDFRRQCVALARPAMLTLAACTIAACTGLPTRPVIHQHAANTSGVRERSSWNAQRSEAQAKRDLAKNGRDSLSASQAGYYLDVLQGRVLQVLGAGTKLSRTMDRIDVDLDHSVQFESTSPWLGEAGCRLLRPLARALVEFRKTLIAVKVGVDGDGEDAARKAERRAHAVAECLANSGVFSRRIVIVAAQSDATTPGVKAAGDALELDVELILRKTKSGR